MAELESRIVARIRVWLHGLPSRPVDELMPGIMADVEVFGVLKAREGYERGLVTRYNPDVSLSVLAQQEYPLPVRTRQVLRECVDLNGGDVSWRWNDGLEYRPIAGTVWNRFGSSDVIGRTFFPFPERIDIWAALKAEPFRTEWVSEYESNPWPDNAP